MLQSIRLPILLTFTIIHTIHSSYLQIQNLHDNPLLLIKTKNCKIQTGVFKIIHPISLGSIQESIDTLASTAFRDLAKDDPLGNIIKYKTSKLYSNFHQLKPSHHHRTRRWDIIGSTWKWIAGSPDADDLRIINSTLSNLTNENNQQYKINENINQRLKQLTHAINNVIDRVNSNYAVTKEIGAITTIMNIDIIEKTIEDIQDAITWSKSSVIANRILSLRDINIIRSSLEEQGISTDFPEEALRFVVPKFAMNKDTLLYILHVPQFANKTSSILRLYPLPLGNQTVYNYPEFLVQDEGTLYTTSKPDETIQKSSYLEEFEDQCIKPLIYGKQTTCIPFFNNRTTQSFITSNSILITNARNDTLRSNCGPDERKLRGNLFIHFGNCTVTFNRLHFQSSEVAEEVQVIHGAFHDLDIKWKPLANHDLAKVSDIAASNRNKLDHVYLQQNSLNLKLWTTFGGFSAITIIGFIIAVFILKNIHRCIKCKSSDTKPTEIEPRRLELEEGGVILEATPADVLKLNSTPHSSATLAATPASALKTPVAPRLPPSAILSTVTWTTQRTD